MSIHNANLFVFADSYVLGQVVVDNDIYVYYDRAIVYMLYSLLVLKIERRGMFMLGKERCKALKEIRQKIAEENDIEYIVQECTFQGECKGTCPKCEEELRYLEKELEKRQKIGKAVIVAGVAIGVISGIGMAAKPLAEWMKEEIEDQFYGLLPTFDDVTSEEF